MSAPMEGEKKEVSCDDILAFQDAMKRMRLIDDRIIYALNTRIPTASFSDKVNVATECEKLFGEMKASYQNREGIIKNCIVQVSNTVNKLKDERKQNEDDLNVWKNLRKEQKKLSIMQNELNIEEILKDRGFRTFDDKCRRVYTVPKLNV